MFGSVVRGEVDEFSGVDFLVRFEKDVSLFDLAGLQEDLGDLLGCPAHVVAEDSLRPEIRAVVMGEAVEL
ncbi:nucleotidyltransferase domain-containing protein [Kyrpidia sp.]|uniref:nucleotidyltransferase family protein n=1 Tax=Kyrpidia sp. TaxID=2073077 RepID=UPI0025861CC6|nr:nucleotidyltransferase domain-containing protein [Kyrpidia sp.]